MKPVAMEWVGIIRERRFNSNKQRKMHSQLSYKVKNNEKNHFK